MVAAFVGAPLVMAACGAQTPEAAGNSDASLAFGTEYSCSGMDISVGIMDDTTMLRADGKEYALLPVETASGAKYAAEGEPETSFWSKGEGGLLVLVRLEVSQGEPDAATLPAWLAADAQRQRGEFVLVLHALPPAVADAAGGIKGRRPSKKDKLRAAAADAHAPARTRTPR